MSVIELTVLLAVPAGFGVYLFNRLVRARNQVREGWSGIDVQLKRRHDLVPNLVSTVQGYAGHEQQVLGEITRLRAESLTPRPVEAAAAAENHLSSSLKALFALVEAYPDLKADANFRGLMDELVDIEDELQLARRYYNGAVRDLNNRVESFPSNLVAALFGFAPDAFFEIERAIERTAPRVDLGTEEP